MSELLTGVIEHSLWIALIVAFLAGILTSLSPCNLSSIPLLIGYLEAAAKKDNQNLSVNKKFLLSFAFIIGTATTFVSMGILFSFMGEFLGPVKEMVTYLAVVVVFIMGLVLLELVPFQLDFSFAGLMGKLRVSGPLGSYGLGFLMGFTTSQCATPVLLVILTYVMLEGDLWFGAGLLFVFALGRGLPLVFLGTFSGLLLSVKRLKKYSQSFQRIMGAVLIMLSFYLFWIA